MLSNELRKHAREFLGYLKNRKYERTERGIYFPVARAFASGEYTHNVNGADERVDHNLLVDEGLDYLLTVGLFNGTKIGTWYLALYGGNYTPVAALTAASFPATASEITSTTEGYTETVRQTWVPTAPNPNIIDNVASKAAFTIATASSLVVYGAALLSESTRGATTGTLMSATKFAAARTLYNTDVFNLGYRVQLVAE